MESERHACCEAHLGAMVMTLWPLLASSTGSPPTTSPRPPVLDQGATCSSSDTSTHEHTLYTMHQAH
jgi:hypothetical protein